MNFMKSVIRIVLLCHAIDGMYAAIPAFASSYTHRDKKYCWAALGALGIATTYYGFTWFKQKYNKPPKKKPSEQVMGTAITPPVHAVEPDAVSTVPIVLPEVVPKQQVVREDSTNIPEEPRELLPPNVPFLYTFVDEKKFHIIVSHIEILIRDRETKQEIALDPPAWLKGQKNLQPRLAICPLQRFFIIAASKYYHAYALDHEIWKLGTSMYGGQIDIPLFCDVSRTPINITDVSIGAGEVGSLGRAPSVVMSKFSFTLEGHEHPWREGYDVVVPYVLSQVPDVEEAFLKYAQCACKGIAASKYLAVKTGMSPVNSLQVFHKDLAMYHQQVLAFQRATQTTALRPGITNRLCQDIMEHNERLCTNPDVMAALSVFCNIYRTDGLHNQCYITRL